MKKTIFFLAFLSFIWVIGLITMQINSFFNKSLKESAIAGYRSHKNKKGITSLILRCIYLVFNGQLIFPFRGLAISFVFIIIFITTD